MRLTETFAKNIIRKLSNKMSELVEVSSNYCFGGYQKVFTVESKELGCKTNFAVYLPPSAEDKKVPVIYWLSGLTCTEQNFITKAGAQQHASLKGVILVAPDTSPRGCNITGEDDSYDLGSGAGFYVDATQKPWSQNYKMYSYVTKELPDIINKNFPALEGKQSIMGHSMGGHGALISALKNPGKYQLVSAFSPICNPSQCPWGQKAFSAYLGENKDEWKHWDATELVSGYSGPPLELLIDQGESDQFLKEKQLLPENLIEACRKKGDGIRAVLNMREKYDHSYFFISTYIAEHINYHAIALNK